MMSVRGPSTNSSAAMRTWFEPCSQTATLPSLTPVRSSVSGGATCCFHLLKLNFFRIRWSEPILNETKAALIKMARERDLDDPEARGVRAVKAMQTAFPEAMVEDFKLTVSAQFGLPDLVTNTSSRLPSKRKPKPRHRESERFSSCHPRPAQHRGTKRRRLHCRHRCPRGGTGDRRHPENAGAPEAT